MISQERSHEAPTTYVMDLFRIFLTFLKISPLTFGGGIAMIPHIESEIVNKRRWLSNDDIPSIVAVAQSAPGSIAINSAIYIGYTIRGITGAIAAMLGMLLPANLIIIVLTYLFLTYQDLSIVQDAFKGIRPAIVGLILFASYRIGKGAIHDRFTLFIFLVTIGLLIALTISPVFMIVGGGLLGLLYNLWGNRR